MPARRGRVSLSITADNSNLKRTVRDSEGDLGRLQRVGVSSTRGLSAGFKAASGLIAGAAIADQIRQTIVAAQESEVSNKKLATQLRASGISYRAHAAEIDKVIQKTSQLSGLDDEDLQDAFTNIIRVTGNVSKSMKLTGLAADFARAKHIDVAKAGEIVGKVAGGNTGILSRYGIQIDKGATATEALGKLQQKFSGQAAAYGKTSAGAQDRFRVATENLREAVGEKLLPILTTVTDKATDFVNQMQDGTGAGGRFVEKLKDIADKVRPIAKFFTDHPKLIAVAVGAWATYRGAAVAATAVTRAKLVGQFLGLGKRAAIGGAEAGAAFGGAASTSGGAAMRGKGGLIAKLRGLGWKGAGTSIGVVFGAAMAAEAINELTKTKFVHDIAQTIANAVTGTSPEKIAAQNRKTSKELRDVAAPGSTYYDPATGKPVTVPGKRPIKSITLPSPNAPRPKSQPKRRAPTSTPVGQNAPRAHTARAHGFQGFAAWAFSQGYKPGRMGTGAWYEMLDAYGDAIGADFDTLREQHGDSFGENSWKNQWESAKRPSTRPSRGALSHPDNRPERTSATPRRKPRARAHSSMVGAGATADRGPAQVKGATTEKRKRALALMQQAWRAAAPYFGRSGKRMPRVQFTGDSSPIVGMARNPGAKTADTGVVYWPDWMTDWLLGLGNPGDQDAAFGTLIHEWAHYFQREGLSDSDAEGGAQAFARRIAPKVAADLGISYRNLPFGSDQYTTGRGGGEVGRVKRTRGEAFITSGQFRGGAHATASAASRRTSVRATAHMSGARSAASDPIAEIESEADRIDRAHVPYLWGGGHKGRVPRGGKVIPMDCSGAVSAVLGIDPRVSGDFVTWGSPGDGGSTGVTIYANKTHVLMKINGRFWGTSRSNPGGGAGWIDGGVSAGYLSGFTVRHMAGSSSAPTRNTSFVAGVNKAVGLTATMGGTVQRVTGTALGAKRPKATGPVVFTPALRPADPGVQAKNMRLFQIGNRINYITAAIQGGRVKNPATLSRLADELGTLGSERDDLLAPPEKPTGLDAIPGAGAYINRLGKDAALAALTPDTADDKKTAQDTVDAWKAILGYGQAHGASDTDIADFATNLKGAQDSLDALTGAVTENTQQLLDLEKQRTEELTRERNVSQAQYDRILDGIAGIANGRLGGRLGLGFATPSYPGRVARP